MTPLVAETAPRLPSVGPTARKPRRARGPLKPAEVESIHAAYATGRSLSEVATLLGVSQSTVWNHLARAGVVRSRSAGNRLAYAHRLSSGRPRTRGDCVGSERPCPWVSCRHHLAIDVRGERLVHVRPKIAADSCSLDVADRGEHSLEQVGNLLGVTRERIRQIEASGWRKARALLPDPSELLREYRDAEASYPPSP